MKVLVVGSGGREHAICRAVAKSERVDKIYCAPGNAGIAALAECVNIGAMEFDKLVAFAKEKEIDLTVIGMDDPLVGGIVDVFEAEGLKVFGPRKNAAILEGSKAFSKDLMKKYNIPTAQYEVFEDAGKALEYLETAPIPLVVLRGNEAESAGIVIAGSTPKDVRNLDSDIRFINVKDSSLAPKGQFFVGSLVFWMLVALLFILAVVLWAALRHLAARRADIAGTRNRKATKMALKRLQLANTFLKQNLYTAFYRETLQKRNRYIGITEAIMHIFKSNYETRTLNRDRVQLLKGRRLISQKTSDTLAIKVEGGPSLSIYLDIVKKLFFNFSNEIENFELDD